jgi:hypothetical protein
MHGPKQRVGLIQRSDPLRCSATSETSDIRHQEMKQFLLSFRLFCALRLFYCLFLFCAPCFLAPAICPATSLCLCLRFSIRFVLCACAWQWRLNERRIHVMQLFDVGIVCTSEIVYSVRTVQPKSMMNSQIRGGCFVFCQLVANTTSSQRHFASLELCARLTIAHSATNVVYKIFSSAFEQSNRIGDHTPACLIFLQCQACTM